MSPLGVAGAEAKNREGFKILAPFILTIYRILMRDLINFFLIYLIFVAGFSQAFYVIFLGYRRGLPKEEGDANIMHPVIESFTRMFIMSLNEFGVFYEKLEECRLAWLGKIMFVLYILLVSILLINMLIAMMTATYTAINESTQERIRQWAAMILMMEQSLRPAERLAAQAQYASAMASKPHVPALVITQRTPEDEMSERKDERKEAQKAFDLQRTVDRQKRAGIDVVKQRRMSRIAGPAAGNFNTLSGLF